MIKTVFILLGLGCLLTSQMASAAACTAVDNRSFLGADRDQDGIGWCYAFAASELVSHKLGVRVSAVDIATSFVSESIDQQNPLAVLHQIFKAPSRPIESGEIAAAILATQNRKHGFCREAEIPSGPKLTSHLRAVTQIKACGLNRDGLCGKVWADTEALFPNVAAVDILNILSRGPSVNAWEQLTQMACTARVSLPKNTKVVRIVASDEISRQKMLDTVDDRLDQGDILGLEYNPLPFYNASWWQVADGAIVDALSASLKAVGQPEIATHAVAIVGRRYNPSKQICEYEIRDSNGPHQKVTRPSFVDPDGRIWYSRSALIAHSHNIIFLK